MVSRVAVMTEQIYTSRDQADFIEENHELPGEDELAEYDAELAALVDHG